MKQLLFLLLFPVLVLGQSTDQNYIKTKVYKNESTNTTLAQDTLVGIDYHDGLGRPVQTISFKSGGKGEDIVTPISYADYSGRQTIQYLPYAIPANEGNSMNYRDPGLLINAQKAYYQNVYPLDVPGQNPVTYSETALEASPLGRVLQQGAPGNNWNINGGHTIKYGYDVNTELSDKVYDFRIKFLENSTEKPKIYISLLSKYYGNGTLYKKIIKNENWQSSDGYNNTSEEFTDLLGRLILKRNYNEGLRHDTYYVYDDYGNLTYVIPPLAADKIVKESFLFSPVPINFPWTKLVEVDHVLAEAYDRKLENYENENILNQDLMSEYNGSGGFSVAADENNNITLSLNFTTTSTMPLRNGIIADLTQLGQFQDKELGILKGDNYEYYFLIENNQIKVTGSGNVPSTIRNFTGNSQLDYQKNYSWAELIDGDVTELSRYANELNQFSQDQILSASINNNYGAVGGTSITFTADDTFGISVNINSSIKPVSLKNGVLFTFDVYRPMPDGYLGEVSGPGYSYSFSLDKNQLIVTGSGEFSNLVFSSSKRFRTVSEIEAEAEKLCYIYHYDSRNRVIEKHIPDNGWTYIVYDKLDRPVMTQDENMRIKTSPEHNWLFTGYDTFGRVALTGSYYTSTTFVSLRETFATQQIIPETRNSTPVINKGMKVFYNNTGFGNAGATVLTVNYYDDYNFDTGLAEVGQGSNGQMPTANTWATFTTKTKGLQTGAVTRVLGTDNYITSFTQYDSKSRPIWVWSYNNYLNAWNSVESSLDFSGNALITKIQHKTGTADKITLWNYYTYDAANRPLQHSQVLGEAANGPKELISWNRYDALGNLVQKKTGGRLTASAAYASFNALQTIDYTKNIRGWLTGINGDQADMSISNDLFSFNLDYDGLYNGNITATSWNSILDNQVRNYAYAYDALNRLTDATYRNSSDPNEKYHENGIVYDKNGNIKNLERWGSIGYGQFDKIDELVYSYKPMSNQLLEIDDKALTFGYNDANKVTKDFGYDIAGNMYLDKNKSIDNISYNHLNLPVLVTKDNGNTIAYTYDATGTKIEKKVTTGAVTATKYSYGFVYENNVLQYFPHPEGYVKRESDGSFSYVYQYKDHLGNIRLSYSDLDKDGVINNVPGFYDGFEGDFNWNGYYSLGQLEIDNTKSRSGKSSGKISSPVQDERYSHSGMWLDINNSQDTYYTYTVYAQSDGPTAEIFLFMNAPGEEGYFTRIDSKAQSVSSTGWTKIEATYLVPAGIKRLNVRLDVNSQGTVWFDDVSLKKTSGVSEILDHTDYYPFGMEHGYNTVMSGGNAVAQKIGYNGKEYEEGLGYNMNEMDWRHYDPAIGRFNCVDKLAETTFNMSPYSFSGNNPVIFADPSGLRFKFWIASDYNWETGTYASGSLENAMAKVGAEFYEVNTEDAFDIYMDMLGSVELGFYGPGGGGGNENGKKTPSAMFGKRIGEHSEILTRYLSTDLLPAYTLEQYYAANFEANTILWFSHGSLNTIAGGMNAAEFSAYLMVHSELFKSAVENNTPLTLKLFACVVGGETGLASQLSILHPNLTIWAANNRIEWTPGNVHVQYNDYGTRGYFNIWVNGDITGTGNFKGK